HLRPYLVGELCGVDAVDGVSQLLAAQVRLYGPGRSGSQAGLGVDRDGRASYQSVGGSFDVGHYASALLYMSVHTQECRTAAPIATPDTFAAEIATVSS